MSTINIQNLTFGYDAQNELLFDHVQLYLDSSWHLGLVGRNGRGKTTFLKLLQNQLDYQGSIDMPMSTQYFPQVVSDPTQLTLYVAQSISDIEQWELERELSLLHVNLDVVWRPFAELSGGEQTKVLLALLFTNADDFALIDEPTTHLDIAGRQQVADYLKRKSGFIVISHDQGFLDQVTDHILAIDRAKISLYQGNYSTYRDDKERQDQYEIAENGKLKKEIGRLKQTAAEKAKWSTAREGDKYGDRHVKGSGAINNTGFIGARAARVMQKRKNLEHRMDKDIESKSQLLKNIETPAELTLNYIPDHHHNLIHLDQFTLGYTHPLFEPIDLDVNRGDRVALTGINGVGKSTLFKHLLGQAAPITSGTLTQAKVIQSLVRQQYPDNRGALADFATARGLDYSQFLNNLRKLGMERNAFTTPIESLSMGQQKKVELAASLSQSANLYFWDEPLNYLDTYNQDQLVQLLNQEAPTMIFIEHDQHFIESVATKVITLQPINPR